MSVIAIQAEGIGKWYRIGTMVDEPYGTMRGVRRLFSSPFGYLRAMTRPPSQQEILWALRDVSFEVCSGDVVGVVGRNGAGKSTLLKILSRITEPSCGCAFVRGRVGSLLEVGTGFHPELTGRENVYLNGAILGMSRAEIGRKFDNIVDFAEVARFLDTPVKRYSSGMYVRLAFAVAAHLEPDVLLIDEVLAVGDVAFQRRCLGKITEVARSGRTVLFVSHNLAAIQSICEKGILMTEGTVEVMSDIGSVVSRYMEGFEERSAVSLLERQDRTGAGESRLSEIVVSNGLDGRATLFTGARAKFTFRVTSWRRGLYCRFTLYDLYGSAVVHFNSSTVSPRDSSDRTVDGDFVCVVDEWAIAPGRYWLSVGIYDNVGLQDHLEAACPVDVEAGRIGDRMVSIESGYGLVCLPHSWVVNDEGESQSE